MQDEQTELTKGRDRTIDIVINGQQVTVTDNRLSYEEVVQLAFPGCGLDILYSVTYSNPRGRDGTLAPGQATVVREGTSFNVIKTNRS